MKTSFFGDMNVVFLEGDQGERCGEDGDSMKLSHGCLDRIYGGCARLKLKNCVPHHFPASENPRSVSLPGGPLWQPYDNFLNPANNAILVLIPTERSSPYRATRLEESALART